MPLRVLRSAVVVVPVGLAINSIVGGGWRVMCGERRLAGGLEGYEARTAMLADEADLDALRLEKILVAAEVVRQGVGGDAGDADFVKEVGGGAGPGGLVFEQRGNGVDDGCGWS